MQFANATEQMHKEVRRRIEACMETGNFDQARVILTEYTEEWPEQAQALRTDLIPKHGTSL